ncbi:MAG: hypothetical protein HY785_11090 [Oscillatoriophycideae cyanobacterium NC_groundwater_1537_Pr4_S-0.65um_50_18]|nr:hypothetical protein [Oscillatoriophycideae cyanobacterium NC_groundwater_1537_Pr4_S-0.65um_50_18]
MELVTLAATVATLFFSEALKEGGKTLGKEVSERTAQLITSVRNKFKSSGTEGLLVRAEKQPSESNIALVEAELVAQIEEDPSFATQLKDLVQQLQAAGAVRQVMASRLDLSGDLEAGDLTQRSTQAGAVDQVMLADVKAQNVKLGNLTQDS